MIFELQGQEVYRMAQQLQAKGFIPDNDRPTADAEARIRIKNAPILLDLTSCDRD